MHPSAHRLRRRERKVAMRPARRKRLRAMQKHGTTFAVEEARIDFTKKRHEMRCVDLAQKIDESAARHVEAEGLLVEHRGLPLRVEKFVNELARHLAQLVRRHTRHDRVEKDDATGKRKRSTNGQGLFATILATNRAIEKHEVSNLPSREAVALIDGGPKARKRLPTKLRAGDATQNAECPKEPKVRSKGLEGDTNRGAFALLEGSFSKFHERKATRKRRDRDQRQTSDADAG